MGYRLAFFCIMWCAPLMGLLKTEEWFILHERGCDGEIAQAGTHRLKTTKSLGHCLKDDVCFCDRTVA